MPFITYSLIFLSMRISVIYFLFVQEASIFLRLFKEALLHGISLNSPFFLNGGTGGERKRNAGAVRFQQIRLNEEEEERKKEKKIRSTRSTPRKKEIGFGGLRDRRWVRETSKDRLRRNYFCISLQFMTREKIYARFACFQCFKYSGIKNRSSTSIYNLLFIVVRCFMEIIYV
ncbi:hypothetical protein CEXT_304281 [Caerostris extrusa]|uniref:Uncharacterized protein n=1 Tax=Caerostris extrusa TaxID=172846 RepID=A0AAV4SK27_CAEEX|nr:hypothetical protein CEXT_304281 [Caerostris extrusa]